MDKLIALGTGCAMMTKYYNTCFSLYDGNEYLLVDGGGGNGILRQIEMAGIDWNKIHTIFLSHSHTDHALGVVWCIRKIAHMIQKGEYDSSITVYGNSEAVSTLQKVCGAVLSADINALIGKRILFSVVNENETKKLGNYEITFFDILSNSSCQYGFRLDAEHGYSLAFSGDEKCHPKIQKYLSNIDWLLCDAYCADRDAAIFNPGLYNHSTVKEACIIAEQLRAKNLILWHTEDATHGQRKALYQKEGRQFYSGTLYVPDDLEVIDIK